MPPTRSGKARIPWADVDAGRRRNMQANRSKNTKPELSVRQMLHSSGYRFRLHRRDLPGNPDIIFPSRKKVVEVRGCFWHNHGCFPLGQIPQARADYWIPKLAATKERDERNMATLRAEGWQVLEVWECRVRAEPDEVRREVTAFLGPPGSSGNSAFTQSVRPDESLRSDAPTGPGPAGNAGQPEDG